MDGWIDGWMERWMDSESSTKRGLYFITILYTCIYTTSIYTYTVNRSDIAQAGLFIS